MNGLQKKKRLLAQRLDHLLPLIDQLSKASQEQERLAILKSHVMQSALEDGIALALCATGGEQFAAHVETASLQPAEAFYASIGGLVGYYGHVLRLLLAEEEIFPCQLSRAPAVSLDGIDPAVLEEGIRAIASMGEIYPIGGLATRLEYRDALGALRPAALLPFCGHSLLEGLIRDVEGREALYRSLFGEEVYIPIALMTSDENEDAIRQLLEETQWFGRPEGTVLLFRQPSVPVVTQEGEWVLAHDASLALQPGGHGALWQTALQEGVFEWFRAQGREHLLIRQINNPLAGLDHALLSFIGFGKRLQKGFGFICCERDPEAAEGVLVLMQELGCCRISNIEYTQVKAYGIEATDSLPANTNVLYVNLEKMEETIRRHPLPGFLLNMKNAINGHGVIGGRLESMMQSMSDHLVSSTPEELPTFLAHQKRSRTISPTKRKFVGKLLETPEGALYDMMCNAHELLTLCRFALPPFCSKEAYIEEGLPLLFCYHPSLGPLYSVIAHKLQGGHIARGAEWHLERVEIWSRQLHLDGSLLIRGAGRCLLENVTIRNRGKETLRMEDWALQAPRLESVEVIVHAGGEFEAKGVTLEGPHRFEVPSQERWQLTTQGLVKTALLHPTWQWKYTLTTTGIELYRQLLSPKGESL